MKKGKKIFIVCLGFVVLFYVFSIIRAYYYANHINVLECFHVIGYIPRTIVEVDCMYIEGQERIQTIYTVLYFLPYVMSVGSFITAIISLIKNKKILIITIMSILIILYDLIVFYSLISKIIY